MTNVVDERRLPAAAPAIDIAATLDWACGDCDVCNGTGIAVRWHTHGAGMGRDASDLLCPRCVVVKLAKLLAIEPELAAARAELAVLRDETGIETLRAGLREAATTIAKLTSENKILADSLEIAEGCIIALTGAHVTGDVV